MKPKLDDIETFMDQLGRTPSFKRFRHWHPDIAMRIRDLLETGNPIVTKFMEATLSTRAEEAETREERWVANYAMTPKEVALASALVGGTTLPDYAAKTGKAYSTVKSQLLSLFRKTGATRQLELVELLRQD